MALSSCKAKYIVASICVCVCQVVWLINLMKELCNEEYEVVTLMIDNIFTINLAKNLIAHGKSKHIDMRFHYLRELVSEEKMKLGYQKSEDQVPEFLTKGVIIEVVKRLKNHMSMEDFEDFNSGVVL